MKKFFSLFFIIFSLLFVYNKAFSYWLNFEGKWFYSSISNNIDSINSEMYSLELQNNWWTSEKIKSRFGKDCLIRDLTEDEVLKISRSWEIWEFSSLIKSDCKNWDDITLIDIQNLLKSVQALDLETSQVSESKWKKVLNFSNLWIYSNWIEWDWPFDLKVDLKLINDIVFENPGSISDYNEGEVVNLWDKIKNLLNNLKTKNNNLKSQNSWENSENNSENENNHKVLCDLSWNCDNFTEVQKLICEVNWNCWDSEKKWFLSIKNEFACKVDNSWLKNEIWKNIGENLEKISSKNWEKNENSLNNSSNFWDSSSRSNTNFSLFEAPTISGNYSKVNDNKTFPCNDFFCIKIDFKLYEHNLIWNFENPSIEYLIKRSNWHLKKHVNSSLTQSKMTTNNFELNLKDLNLSEMFHMWVQITHEPIPILDLNKDLTTKTDKTDDEDKWPLKLDSQLKKYYESYGLNYDLRNDLSAYNQIEKEAQASLNSNWVNVLEMWKKLEQLREIENQKIKEISEFQGFIEEQVRTEKNSDFEIKMKEVEWYTKAINDYVKNLEAILKEMQKIPVNKSTS